jgi:hypothetical protein
VSEGASRSQWIEGELGLAEERYRIDQSFRVIPVLLDSTTILHSDFIKRFQSLTVKDGDVQDVAVRVRDALDFRDADESERDQNVRIRTELEEAIKEKERIRRDLGEERKRDRWESGREKERLQRRLLWVTAAGALLSLIVGFFAFWEYKLAVERSFEALRERDMATAAAKDAMVQRETAIAARKDSKERLDQLADQLTRLLSDATGIKIGMSLDQVKQQIGEPRDQTVDSDNNRVLTYLLPRVGTVFVTLDNSNKVVRIGRESPKHE